MTDTFGSEPQDHDVGATQDGDAVHELPSEEEFTVEDQKSPASGKAHRSPVLPIAAAVGGVFLLGAVAWWQFSGNSTSVQGFSADSFSIPPAPVAELPITPPPVQAEAQPAPKTSLVEAPKESEILAPPPVAPETVTAAPPAPVVASVPMGAPGASPPAGTSVPVPVASAEAVPAPLTPEQRIEALTSRIDALQKTVDSLTGGEASGETAALPSYKALSEKIEKLEQKLSTADRSGHSTRAVSDPKRSSKPKAERTSQKKSSGLVLRAASNGQAWVSNSVNSTDLKEVQVGDSLPGIGRVTDIKMQGDKWVIQGTKGTLQ